MRQFRALGVVGSIIFCVGAPDPRAIAGESSSSPPSPRAVLRGFVANLGQFPDSVCFRQVDAEPVTWFERGAFTVVAHAGERACAVRFSFESRGVSDGPLGVEPQGWVCNYFVGNDPSRFAVDVPTFSRVRYPGVRAGIDVEFFESEGKVEYDLVCEPGAVPSCVLLVEGASQLTIGTSGELRIATPLGDFVQSRPQAFEIDENGKRVPVDCDFVLLDDRRYSFRVSTTGDRRCVIDPSLTFSSYLGGTGNDQGRGLAVNSSGQAFVVGGTTSSGFPTTVGAFDTTGGGQDAFVVRMNSPGTAPVFATFLGGSLASDSANAVDLDASGAIYVVGTSVAPTAPFNSDYPVTVGAFDTTPQGPGQSDGFVTKLNANGNALVYSTFLGGGLLDLTGIDVDGAGTAFVAGFTFGIFPVTPGAFDTTFNASPFSADGFVARVNATGSALLYASYLGSPSTTTCNDITADSSGNAVVVGRTNSAGFPATVGVVDPTIDTAFVTKFNSAGSALVFSTGLGGATHANAVDIDPSGAVVVGGATVAGLLTTPTAVDTTFGGGVSDGFLVKLFPDGSAVRFGTYLGGAGSDVTYSVDTDPRANSCALVSTQSAGLSTTAGAPDSTLDGASDGYVAKVSTDGDVLLYASYLGGSGDEPNQFSIVNQADLVVDAVEDIYVVGATTSTNYPTTVGAFDTASGGGVDAFLTKAKSRTCTQNAASAKYGTGKPGTNGVPQLDSVNLPYLSATQSIRISNGLPGAPVTMFLGVAPLALAFDQGTLLVNPLITLALPPLDGNGALTLTTTLPDDPTLCGVAVYHQAIFVDPGATGFYHTAQTNGLMRTLGS